MATAENPLSALTPEEMEAVLASKRDGTLLFLLRQKKPAPLPIKTVQTKVLDAVTIVGKDIWHKFDCDGKFNLSCNDVEPGIFYFCNFKKTIKTCIQREHFHFDDAYNTVYV